MKKGMVTIFIFSIFAVLIFVNPLAAQKPKKDTGNFVEPKNEFWDEIKKSSDEFRKDKKPEKKSFKMDFSGYDLPKSTDEFTKFWHNPPISQGWTGTCWCFSSTSYFESEIKRLYNKEVKLSEMFTVYWEYVEKARRFVSERGNSAFEEGSQGNAIIRIFRKYGCVPEESYTGLKPGQSFHDHTALIKEMKDYLNSVKKNCAWNEDVIIATIKTILNHYLGVPPVEVNVDGRKMTPMQYFADVVKINTDDYVDLMSLMEKPYWQKAEYEVTDNWWKFSDYYNVPLDDFMNAIKSAIKKDYTIEIGGDVSEAGYESHVQTALVPTFDIPSEYIDENARQFRFSNGSTTDDHGVHIVGWKESKGKTWFLIKDSGSGSRNGTNKGYYFWHEDYVKLKMMNITIHKSAVEDILKKFGK